ncbi:TPA: energy-coupling factor transporter transmembrane protein EcfT, partial [Staphylococcus aureus]|nr:energy-coupling factor transporter transmembrane protein EcfT [Staphylococcus aureus]
NVPFSYKDVIFIIVLIAIITLAYYCSITLPITGIDDVRLGRVG